MNTDLPRFPFCKSEALAEGRHLKLKMVFEWRQPGAGWGDGKAYKLAQALVAIATKESTDQHYCLELGMDDLAGRESESGLRSRTRMRTQT